MPPALMGFRAAGRGVSLQHQSHAIDVLPAAKKTARAEWAQTAVLAASGATSVFLLNGWNALLPWVVVPAIAGACIGACSTSKRQALVAGLASALAGGAVSMWLYLSIPTSVRSLVVASLIGDDLGLLAVALAVVVAPIVALAVYLLVAGHAEESPRRRVVEWSTALVVALSLLVTMSGPVQRAGATASVQPVAGAYATDNMLNRKTYHLMADGDGFYNAYVKAHAMDSRRLYAVQDGKFASGSAAMMRQPTMFVMWGVVGPDHNFMRVVQLSVLLSAVLLVATYAGLWKAIGPRSLFISTFIFPFFVTQATTATSMLQPEWWATLAVLGGFLALVSGRPLSAGLLGLVAVTFRETSGVWLLAMGACAVVFALHDRRAWRWVAAYFGLLAIGVAMYAIHVAVASRYVIHPTNSSVVGYLLYPSGVSVLRQLGPPLEYLMVAYGSSLASTLWLVPAGLVGLWIGLRRVPSARLSAMVYVTVFLIYFAVLGVKGPYWGQLVTPLLVMGAGLAIASADRIMDPATWRVSLGDARWGD